jgi:hypothetical protein
MESFAPAYFDYMSSAVSANVRVCHYQDTRELTRYLLATDTACENFRLLQVDISEGKQRKRVR